MNHVTILASVYKKGGGNTLTQRFFLRRWLFLVTCLAAHLGYSVPCAAIDFWGDLSNRYKFRTSGAVADHDLESVATLNLGQPSIDKFSAALRAGGNFDLNGQSTDTTFGSIYDTIATPAVGRLYYAYLDIEGAGPFATIRLGRQQRFEFESAYFDGAFLRTDPWYAISLDVYGGVPVHLYETQLGWDPGDWTVGAALEWNPNLPLQVRLDYTHLRDKRTAFRFNAGDTEDDLFGSSLWWGISDNVGFTSRFTAFSDQVRDVRSTLNLNFPKIDFSLRLDGYRLLKGYDVRVFDWDAFSNAGTYRPYNELSLTATKYFGEHVAVDAGGTLRWLDNRQIASPFNHGYERAFLSASLFDLPWESFQVTATGDYYHGRDSDFQDNTFGGSFSVSKGFAKDRFEVEAGTAYYLYRYNLFTAAESNDVQTYFLFAEGELVKHLTAKVGYEFENNDLDDFHSMQARLTWSFE